MQTFIQNDEVAILPVKKIKQEYHNKRGVITKWHHDNVYSVHVYGVNKRLTMIADEIEHV